MKNILKYGIIICTCLLISPYSLAKTVIKEDVKYNLNDKKMTAVYEEYVGKVESDETEYVFPREVSVEGRTYVVDKIAANAGKRIPAKKIVFSDVANKILISDLYRFEIDINSKNPNFMIKDNVLYTKDKKILLKSGKQEGAVKIINGVETIEKKAFANSSLQEITFPRSLKNIQNRIFLNCKKLKKIQIASGNSYMTVVDGAIYSKNKRKLLNAGVVKGTFKLPRITREMEPYAVAENQMVKKVVITGKMKKISKGAFAGCRNLEKVELSSGTKIISENAFMNCPSLRKIKLPDKVQILKRGAFKNCGFTKLIIPKSVNKIEKNVLETTIGILKFKGEKIPKIATQEVCLFGKNEAGEQVSEYLDEMYNYDIIRGIGTVIVPEGKSGEYRKKLEEKMRYQTIKES